MIGAVQHELQNGPQYWTVILSASGLLAGVVGAWLGYRGQSKSANAEETAAIFDGQSKLITNLQRELERCNKSHRATDERIKWLETDNRDLRDELYNLASDFHGLLNIVQDEIAKAAGESSIARVESTLQQHPTETTDGKE